MLFEKVYDVHAILKFLKPILKWAQVNLQIYSFCVNDADRVKYETKRKMIWKKKGDKWCESNRPTIQRHFRFFLFCFGDSNTCGCWLHVSVMQNLCCDDSMTYCYGEERKNLQNIFVRRSENCLWWWWWISKWKKNKTNFRIWLMKLPKKFIKMHRVSCILSPTKLHIHEIVTKKVSSFAREIGKKAICFFVERHTRIRDENLWNWTHTQMLRLGLGLRLKSVSNCNLMTLIRETFSSSLIWSYSFPQTKKWRDKKKREANERRKPLFSNRSFNFVLLMFESKIKHNELMICRIGTQIPVFSIKIQFNIVYMTIRSRGKN